MPLIPLNDPADERLVDYVSLTDVELRRVREPAMGLYIAESAQVIRRAIEAGHHFRSVLLDARWVDRSPDIIAAAERDHAPTYVLPAAALEGLTGYRVHRGALAAMHRPSPIPVESVLLNATRVVVLADIVDHTNVGAIFRSVAGLGADAVLVSPACADPLYRRSVRVSMGAVLSVPWARLAPWPAGLSVLRKLGFVVAAMSLSDAAVDVSTLAQDPPAKCALVLGTEGDGLAPSVCADADLEVRIPMSGGIDSLNVAAAAAVALWALRTRAT